MSSGRQILIHTTVIIIGSVVFALLYFAGNELLNQYSEIPYYLYNRGFGSKLLAGLVICTFSYLVYLLAIFLVKYMKFRASVIDNFSVHIAVSILAFAGFLIVGSAMSGSSSFKSLYVIKNALVFLAPALLMPWLHRTITKKFKSNS